MKVALIGPFPLDTTLIQGGIESSVLGLARELSLAHDVYVHDFPRKGIDDKTDRFDSLVVFRYNNFGRHNLDMARRIPSIVKALKDNPVDICHIHGTNVFCKRLFISLKREGIPVILTVHGLAHIEKKKLLSRRFSFTLLWKYIEQSIAEKRLLSICEQVIVDTPYVARAIASYGLKKIPRIYVIPQGINPYYSDICANPDSNQILSVGTFSERKGQILLIQAFERVLLTCPQARLSLCGIVSDRTYYNRLLAYLSTSPCRDKVSITANASQEELLSLYKKAHVFCLHSQEESQGIVFAEAMAAGIPIVSTRVGGIPDVVAEGETGFLSDYDSIDHFAQNIVTLMTNRKLWEDMSEQCRLSSKRYSWTSIAKSVESIYNDVLIDSESLT